MGIILLILRLLLAATFAIAGVAKLADLAGSRQSLAGFGVPASLVRPLAWLLPAAELTGAVALIPLASAWYGASGVLALLCFFMAGIGISLARGRRPDCHCFGQLHSAPIGWKTLARNGVLAAMAALVVAHGPASPGAGVVSSLAAFSPLQAIVLALAGLAAFQSWSLFHLLRQNGRLMLRLEALESRLGAGAGPLPAGLPVDSPAPDFSLPGLDGEMVTLNMLHDKGRPVLLLFTEPACGACDLLLPEVARWQHDHADRLFIVPISRGSVEANLAKNNKHNVQHTLLQIDREIAKAYQADLTPAAVLVTSGRIASPVATGVEDIRGLVVRATLPPAVKQGDPAPALQLPDLDGKTVDLATLRGHRTLLLFWNPSCGFCQQMLADLKNWERNPLADAPELLVVSTGSAEANRQQGFRSKVLLDEYFAAGQVFGAGGTPAAVMLDEEGRVASEVGVGAPAVLTLAGTAHRDPTIQ